MREIQALRRLSPNQHVITLEEVLYDQPTGRLALVFELMDANLYELIRGRRHYLNGQVRQKEETGSRIVTTGRAKATYETTRELLRWCECILPHVCVKALNNTEQE